MVNVEVPMHPASPVPVVLTVKIPVSVNPPGQVDEFANCPHDGVSRMLLTELPWVLFGDVLFQLICRPAGMPVTPAFTDVGNVGVTPSPTPASAGVAPKRSAVSKAHSAPTPLPGHLTLSDFANIGVPICGSPQSCPTRYVELYW